MEQLGLLFKVDDRKKERTGGCAYPTCNKMPARNSAYCPNHVAVVAWEAKAAERKRERAAKKKEERTTEEEFLAVSPLSAANPLYAKPPQGKRRVKSNGKAKVPA